MISFHSVSKYHHDQDQNIGIKHSARIQYNTSKAVIISNFWHVVDTMVALIVPPVGYI